MFVMGSASDGSSCRAVHFVRPLLEEQHMLGEPCEIAVRYINVVRSVRPFREERRELGGSLAGTEGRNGSPK